MSLEAEQAIRMVFFDTTVSPEHTLYRLEALRDELGKLIDVIEWEIEEEIIRKGKEICG